MNSKIIKLLKHFKEGTVFNRILLIPVLKKEREYLSFEKSEQKKIIKKLSGIKMYLYKDSSLSVLIYNNRFENDEIQFIKKFLKKGHRLIDIGANIGLFSLIAAKIVTDEGRVISFEPTPITFDRLVENIRLNNFLNIQPIPLALSDKNSELSLFCHIDGKDAWNTFATPQNGNYTTINVKTVCLDDYCKENYELFSDINLMKIDAEGWEIPIIKGGKDFLGSEKAPALLIEFSDLQAERANYKCSDLYDLLISYGYRLYKYNRVDNLLVYQKNKDYYIYENLIAIKNEKNCPITCING